MGDGAAYESYHVLATHIKTQRENRELVIGALFEEMMVLGISDGSVLNRVSKRVPGIQSDEIWRILNEGKDRLHQR